LASNSKKGRKRAPSKRQRSPSSPSKKAAPSRKPREDRGGRRGNDRVRTISASQSAGGARPDARTTQEAAQAAEAAINAALDKKALMPVLIDVSSLASYTDFIGIVSGRSDRQVDAIAEGVLAVMKTRGRTLLGQEGSGSGRWTLLDFGDVVIHVFYHPVREFYDLESLWVDAPRVPLKIPPEAIMAHPDALYGNF
jgi:ribosome-associated protein